MRYQAHHYVTIVYDFEVEAESQEDAEDKAFEQMETEGPWLVRDDAPKMLSDALDLFGWQYADLDDSTTVEPGPTEVAP